MSDHECVRCPQCDSCPVCAADALDRVVVENDRLRDMVEIEREVQRAMARALAASEKVKP